MELLIFKIIIIILLIRIIYLICKNLLIVFNDKVRKFTIETMLKDIDEYVRDEHMCNFFINCVWLYILIKLLIAAYSGNITINYIGG